MKEIMCMDKECEYNFMNHCLNKEDLLKLNPNGICLNFKLKKDYQPRIKETNKTETKADLKDAEKVKALAQKRD